MRTSAKCLSVQKVQRSDTASKVQSAMVETSFATIDYNSFDNKSSKKDFKFKVRILARPNRVTCNKKTCNSIKNISPIIKYIAMNAKTEFSRNILPGVTRVQVKNHTS